MIILGTTLIAIGAAILAGVDFMPALLIGLGSGMVISGVTGKWTGSIPLGPRAKAKREDRGGVSPPSHESI